MLCVGMKEPRGITPCLFPFSMIENNARPYFALWTFLHDRFYSNVLKKFRSSGQQKKRKRALQFFPLVISWLFLTRQSAFETSHQREHNALCLVKNSHNRAKIFFKMFCSLFFPPLHCACVQNGCSRFYN